MITRNENIYPIFPTTAIHEQVDEKWFQKSNGRSLNGGHLRKNNRRTTRGRRTQRIAIQTNPGYWPAKFKEIFIKHTAR